MSCLLCLTYNSNTLVVDVGGFVKFFFKLCVARAGSEAARSVNGNNGNSDSRGNILDTTRVQSSSVDGLSDHFERRGMVVVGLLLRDLLSDEI